MAGATIVGSNGGAGASGMTGLPAPTTWPNEDGAVGGSQTPKTCTRNTKTGTCSLVTGSPLAGGAAGKPGGAGSAGGAGGGGAGGDSFAYYADGTSNVTGGTLCTLNFAAAPASGGGTGTLKGASGRAGPHN
jgi:hypothetical protein